jgi:transcriptional regulator with XRE-family HTH domain
MVSYCPATGSPDWRYAESAQWRPSGMANRIKELREARKITLQQIADAAGTTLQQIQRLENGKRRLTDEWMRRIAPVLGVHPAALLLEFSEGHHSLQESVDEVLLLEAWRISDAAKKWQVIDVLFPGQRRIPHNQKKLKA